MYSAGGLGGTVHNRPSTTGHRRVCENYFQLSGILTKQGVGFLVTAEVFLLLQMNSNLISPRGGQRKSFK